MYDCLGSRLRQAAEHDDAAQVREVVAGGADSNYISSLFHAAIPEYLKALCISSSLRPECSYISLAQGLIEHDDAAQVRELVAGNVC